MWLLYLYKIQTHKPLKFVITSSSKAFARSQGTTSAVAEFLDKKVDIVCVDLLSYLRVDFIEFIVH